MSPLQYFLRCRIYILAFVRANDVLGDGVRRGRMRGFVNYSKVGENVCFSSRSSYIHVMKGLQKAAAPSSIKFPPPPSFFLLYIYMVKNNKFQRRRVENQPLWCVWERRRRVICSALETTGSVKCTTAQLHISFDCQFVLCVARSFELRLKMKANLVHSVSTVDRCCCLFASGTIKGFGTIFFSLSFFL